MFDICIDENGYYCEGVEGTFVEVKEIPEVTNVKLLKAYYYDGQTLKKDEEKYNQIISEISDNSMDLSEQTSFDQERLEAAEAKNAELEGRIRQLEKLVQKAIE